MWFALAQVFGVMKLIIFCLGIQTKQKKDILKFQAIANVFAVLQYFLLGAYTGAVIFAISIIRAITFYQCEKKHSKNSVALLITFLMISLFFGAVAYQNIFSILPIATSIVITYSIWQKRSIVTKIGIITCSVIFIVYNIHTQAYAALLTNIVVIISTLISIFRYNKLNEPSQ